MEGWAEGKERGGQNVRSRTLGLPLDGVGRGRGGRRVEGGTRNRKQNPRGETRIQIKAQGDITNTWHAGR